MGAGHALDEKLLKNAGHDTKRLGWWACLIVPVYLYKRAKALNQSKWYFIAFLICWVIEILISIAIAGYEPSAFN